jgi:uncharacterized protein (TIGR01319 family)
VRDRTALLVDIGSTYTKVVVVDLSATEVLAQGRSITTVERDVTLGLKRALAAAGVGLRKRDLAGFTLRLACSSAAGGLSLVAIGLVPELTAEAARRAALGAGAVVQDVYSYQLTHHEVARMETLQPDIILLAGGTDGGEATTIVHNAVMLAESRLRVPVVVAGNKAVGEQVMGIFRQLGVDARLTENVMPRLNTLNVEPVQHVIRQVFLEHIVAAKGLDRAEELLEAVAMPTPSAVLAGARLLADGLTGESGSEELLVVDVGGATTDVHSVADGQSTQREVIYRGLPEPRIKRTVEGDLGLRVSAPSLLAALNQARVSIAPVKSGAGDRQVRAEQLRRDVSHLPETEEDWALDAALGRGAAELAVARHAGRLEELMTPQGPVFIQRGKDLSQVEMVVGTGGVFAHHHQARFILQGAVADQRDPFLLAPRQPRLYLDRRHVFWAAGLLAEGKPQVGLRLLKRYLEAPGGSR